MRKNEQDINFTEKDIKELNRRIEMGEVCINYKPHNKWGDVREFEYYENGNVLREVKHINGQDVLVSEWYEDGNKKMRWFLKNGQMHGLWTFWYPSGEKKTVYWKNGEIDKTRRGVDTKYNGAMKKCTLKNIEFEEGDEMELRDIN